jgi:hypothetical protein
MRPEKEQEITKGNVFLYSGLAPLIQVSSLTTAQFEYLTASASTTTAAVRNGARGENRMRKTCDQDGFYPVVEVAHSNNP